MTADFSKATPRPDRAELVRRLLADGEEYYNYAVQGREYDTRPLSKEAAEMLEADAARIAELKTALGRVLDDVTFMIERQMIPDVRADVIYVRARAALEDKG